MKPNISRIEIEAGTVEEAIKKALAQLKVARDQVQIKVISEEEKGLFGMPGARLAKVRVTIKENT